MIRRIVLLALLLCATMPAGSQQDSQQDKDKSEAQRRNAAALQAFTQEAPAREAERALLLYGVDAFPCEKEAPAEPVHKSCLEARQAYYDYYAKGLARRTLVYEWNNFSTRVIFFVVLGLVAVGVYFSWKQFFGTVRPVTGPAKDEEPFMTEFEAGMGGIRVKSPVLGVILLTVSLAFFYLYLKFVYPVTPNF